MLVRHGGQHPHTRRIDHGAKHGFQRMHLGIELRQVLDYALWCARGAGGKQHHLRIAQRQWLQRHRRGSGIVTSDGAGQLARAGLHLGQ